MSPSQVIGLDHGGKSIRVDGDRIASLGEASDSGGPCTLRFEAGRINAHTHIYSGLAPLGMPAPDQEPVNFLEILERVWWRLDRALDENSLRASARYYVAEALLAGTTTLIDHHESPEFIDGSLDVLADACEELGMRAVLCFGATERNGGRDEAHRGLEECRRFLSSNRRTLVRGVVGLHASFTVSDETIIEAAELCREFDTVLHVHLAEDMADLDDAKARGFEGPLERLLSLGALPAGSILAHGVHCSREQVLLAASEGLWFVQNPRSNRGNRVGYPRALDACPRVAIGTDGYASVLEDEAKALREEAVRHGEDEEIVEKRLLGGWSLAGELFGSRLAPLRRGSKADLLGICNGLVQEVFVDGRKIIEGGTLLTCRIEDIREEARIEAESLWARMRELS